MFDSRILAVNAQVRTLSKLYAVIVSAIALAIALGVVIYGVPIVTLLAVRELRHTSLHSADCRRSGKRPPRNGRRLCS